MKKTAEEKQGIYCDLVNWIDNNYICKGTGKPCRLGDSPNQYECLEYKKLKKPFK